MMMDEEYKLLKGEGERVVMIRTRRNCDVCGELAAYRQSFLLRNSRGNPASSGFGGDDISWCSDADAYFCEEHKKDGWRSNYMEGYEPCSQFSLDKFPHMGLFLKEVKGEVGDHEIARKMREYKKTFEEAIPVMYDLDERDRSKIKLDFINSLLDALRKEKL